VLPRKNLISLKEEFPRIRREGKLYDCPSFSFLLSFGTKSERPQCAFVVSKKISLKSVVRHDVKRKLADAVGKFLPRMKKNVQLVFLPKQKSVTASRSELETEMKQALERARLI